MSDPNAAALAAVTRLIPVPPPELGQDPKENVELLTQFAQEVLKALGDKLAENRLALEAAKAYIYLCPETKASFKAAAGTGQLFAIFRKATGTLPRPKDFAGEMDRLWSGVSDDPEVLERMKQLSLADEFMVRAENAITPYSKRRLEWRLLFGDHPIRAVIGEGSYKAAVIKLMVEVYGADRIRAAEKDEKEPWLRQMAQAGVFQPSGFDALAEIYSDPTEIFELLKPNPKRGSLVVRVASKDLGCLKALIRLLKKLDPEQRKELLKPDHEGASILTAAADHLDKLLLIQASFSAEELAPCFSRDNTYNKQVSPLDRAAGAENPECLRAIIDMYPADRLKAHLKPNEIGSTPLMWATINELPEQMEIISELYNDEELKETLKPNLEGENLLHLVLNPGRPKAFEALLEMFRDAGLEKELERAMTQENDFGSTPLFQLVHAAGGAPTQLFRDVMSSFPRDILAQALKANSDGVSPLIYVSDNHEQIKVLGKLVRHLDGDDWAIVRALGKSAASLIDLSIFQSYLDDIYESPVEKQRFLLMSQFVYSTEFSAERLSGFLEMTESELLANPVTHMILLGSETPDDKHPYPVLRKELGARISDSDEPQIVWQQQLYQVLAATEAPADTLGVLHPLFHRLQDLAAPSLRDDLTRLMLNYELGTKESIEDMGPFLDATKNLKGPCLYLLPMAALAQRGVNADVLMQLHLKIQARAMTFHEDHSGGRIVLQALCTLAIQKRLGKWHLEYLLYLISQDPVNNSLAITQIIGMGLFGKLSRRYLTATDKDLSTIAADCFHKVVPFPNLDGFVEKFNEAFGRRRSPESIITYASAHGQTEASRRILGNWVHSVLTGNFLKQRYAEGNSDHLDKLYELMPDLRGELPKLCKTMGCETVASLVGARGGLNFPLDRDKLEAKILDQGHIPMAEARFPYLWKFLKGDPMKATEYYQKLFKTLNQQVRDEEKLLRQRTRDGQSTREPAVRIAELRFQQFLMKICVAGTDKAKEQALRKVETYMDKLSSSGKPVGAPFIADVKGALKAIELSKGAKTDAFRVFLSDDYWDLFRIGSDVQGSCQDVHGIFSLNRCLMGYVLDGRTFPIVVKRPGREEVVARRMLRIEIDVETDRPAFFLESCYSNYAQKEVDLAIIAMAKGVAQKLGMPLYSATVEGEATEVTLVSEGNAGDWVYSDASDGVTEGCYEIVDPDRIYPLSSSTACSSSSSHH